MEYLKVGYSWRDWRVGSAPHGMTELFELYFESIPLLGDGFKVCVSTGSLFKLLGKHLLDLGELPSEIGLFLL